MYSSYAGGDKYFLAVQAKDLLQGNGLSIPKYFISHTDDVFYDYTPLWPPGYPLFLAPFLKLFNYDLYWASTCLDLIVCIALILVIRKICRQIGFPPIAINLMTLIAGCFEYPFITDSSPTDTISLLFFLVGISFTLKIVASESFSLKNIFLTGLFLFLPCFFRYAYLPISLAVPLSIIFFSLKLKNKVLLKSGLWIAGITFLLNAILLISLKIMFGQSTYVTPTQRGLYPENLIHWYSAIPASFIDFPFLTSQIIKYTSIDLNSQLHLLELINIVSVLILMGVLFFFLFIKKSFKDLNPFKWFVLLMSICTILLLLTLGYLSFTYQVQQHIGNNWNYIYEARYFALVTLFIQFLFLGWVFLFPKNRKSMVARFIICSLSILLFVEVIHSLYFHTKVALNYSKYKSLVYYEQDYKYFENLIPSLKNQYPDKDIFVASPSDKCYLYMAAYYNEKGIFDGSRLRIDSLIIKKPSTLIIMLFDEEVHEYQKFLSEKSAVQIHKIYSSNFYLIELNP